MSPPLLELHGVVVRPGGRTILDVPALHLDHAATVAVLGANGAGKSTLLRVAGGLRARDEGEILLDGAAASPAQIRRVTAAVLQRPLLRRTSVRANAETGLRFRRVPRPEARRRAAEWLGRLGLEALADRPAHTLSGGEAQRVSLARAFAVEPRLLLLDEPFAALDAPTRGELLADLRTTLAETRTAALLVTHDRDEAAAVADRIAVLHRGELRQAGPAAHVLDHPADGDCARILGYENVLDGPAAARLLGGPPRARAMRAEDVLVEPRTGASVVGRTSGESVAGTIRRIVPLGPVTRVEAQAGGAALRGIAVGAAADALLRAATGDPVVLRFAPGRARPLGEDRGLARTGDTPPAAAPAQ